MKGRMRPYLPELTIRDYNIYLRYLRGVRRQLYEAYGLYSCHLLRSNGMLFAILSDSLAGRQATCQRKRVPGTLAWRRLMCQTQGIRLAAQVEVLLGWHNLQDRKYSELRRALISSSVAGRGVCLEPWAEPNRMRFAMRFTSTVVLPLPAPARMSNGPSVVNTACRCISFRRPNCFSI